MSNLINNITNTQPVNIPVQLNNGQNIPAASQQVQNQPIGTNILEKYMRNQGIIASYQVNPVNNNIEAPQNYKNDLRTKFRNNDAKIMVSKNLIIGGLRFCNDFNYDGIFKNTEMYNFLNTYFARDIVPSVIPEMISEEKKDVYIKTKIDEHDISDKRKRLK